MSKKNREAVIEKAARKKAEAEAAEKKAKRQKAVTITVVSIAVVCIVALIVFLSMRQSGNRVYEGGGQTITLRTDGTFNATLAHPPAKNGTYTESTENGVTAISFTIDGETVTGTISETGTVSGSALTIPEEWDDGHGHGNVLHLK